MFSVYGVKGRLFSGPLDEMRTVPGVRALVRSRAIEPLGQEAHALSGGESGHRTVPPDIHFHAATTAYEQATAPERQPLTQVRQVMGKRLVTLEMTLTVAQAWEVMQQQGVGQAPVVDGAGVLVGMIVRWDLLPPDVSPLYSAVATSLGAWWLRSVERVMWSPVPGVHDDADLRHVARLLLDTRLPGLPVVEEGGKVTGYVSRRDLLQALAHDPPLDLWS